MELNYVTTGPMHCIVITELRKTKPRPQLTSTGKFAKFGHAVFEICEQAYGQTDKHAYHNTLAQQSNNRRRLVRNLAGIS